MIGLQKAIIGAVLIFSAFGATAIAQNTTSPLVIGDTFTIDSKILGEKRIINVYLPPGYQEAPGWRVPVFYMPDGGIAEDFLHVAGLVRVSVGNETMRPFLLVGIENTERRRDMTGPTENEDGKKIAPRVGGSAAFRKFIRSELMPQIKSRYRTTDETAIVGESLAGNPAEVLVAALGNGKLDARVVEVLPWLVSQVSETSWKEVVRAAKIKDLQNRPGFVTSLARAAAEKRGERKIVDRLKRREDALAASRLFKEDTLCADFLSETERKWVRQNRTAEAEFWRVLSDLKAEHLSYAA